MDNLADVDAVLSSMTTVGPWNNIAVTVCLNGITSTSRHSKKCTRILTYQHCLHTTMGCTVLLNSVGDYLGRKHPTLNVRTFGQTLILSKDYYVCMVTFSMISPSN